MFSVWQNWFTERDNSSYCIVRALMSAGAISMIYKFVVMATPSFQDFGVGLAAIGAAIAAKNWSEKDAK